MNTRLLVLVDKDQLSKFLVVTPGAPGSITLTPGFPDGVTPSVTPSTFPMGSTLASIATAAGITFASGVRLVEATLQTDVNYIL